jgi:sulfocyanin
VIEPDTTKINQYVSYDAGAKTVAITVIGAATSAQGGFNFNGGSSGNQTITVPAGWTVNIDFTNHDIIPHSAIVITNQTPIPTMPENAALPRAYTSHLSDGLPAQTGHDTMHFTTRPAGDYLLACGVPGHATSGMYIHFVVSSSATAPTNTGTIGPE